MRRRKGGGGGEGHRGAEEGEGLGSWGTEGGESNRKKILAFQAKLVILPAFVNLWCPLCRERGSSGCRRRGSTT